MTHATSTAGRTVGGRYVLRSAIGTGAMGTVWRAHDELLRRDVAVKEVLLPSGLRRSERAMLCQRTMREARSAASLNDPSVIRIYDVVQEDGRPWIVMELIHAPSLADLVRDSGPLRPARVADIGLQVLGALAAAHAAGILHRDVKPGNILVGEDGRATLTDFGVARGMGDSSLTSTGLLVGSPAYLSPERARGQDPGPASDLWALGATLYTAVEGEPPFERGDPLLTLTAVVSEPPAPFKLAGRLAPVLGGLLEKDPDRRWDVDRTRAGLLAVLPIGSGRLTASANHAALAHRSAVARDDADTRVSQRWRPPETRTAVPSDLRWRRARGPVARRAAVSTAATVAILLGGAIGWYASAHRTVAAPPSAPAERPRAEVPPNYVRYEHPAGFSFVVPKGWTRRAIANGNLEFRDPGGSRFLRVTHTPTQSDIFTVWDKADRLNRTALPGYQLVGIKPARVGHRTGADWEFTHAENGRRHVLDRGLVVDGTAIGFYLSTPEDEFPASRSIVDVVAGSFSSPG